MHTHTRIHTHACMYVTYMYTMATLGYMVCQWKQLRTKCYTQSWAWHVFCIKAPTSSDTQLSQMPHHSISTPVALVRRTPTRLYVNIQTHSNLSIKAVFTLFGPFTVSGENKEDIAQRLSVINWANVTIEVYTQLWHFNTHLKCRYPCIWLFSIQLEQIFIWHLCPYTFYVALNNYHLINVNIKCSLTQITLTHRWKTSKAVINSSYNEVCI